MSILRYTASVDTTITNAFEENLSTRGTGSNMGSSDILETFSIYQQATSASVELSRILIKFPISQMQTDRTGSVLPASGSVTWKLKLYNAKHVETVPRTFTLQATAVSASWQEGTGLDMEGYTDLTNDEEGSNWINANDSFVSASATLTALSKTAGEANTRKLTVADSSGNSVEFTIDNSTSTSTATVIAFANANSNATQFATNIVSSINLAKAASALNVTASSDSASMTLTQTAKGLAGNSAADISGTAITDSVLTVVNQFSGGDGQWSSIGGDYNTTEGYVKTQDFDTGLEDLEIDVSAIVEKWLLSSSPWPNYGFGIRLTDAYEGYFSSSNGLDTATEIHNTSGAEKSYYTKKFFGRNTEFFFKRPVLEAQFNDTKKDDRSNFILSSSALPAADNLNKLYLYNYVRGRLVDIGGDADAQPILKLYYSSGSVPEGAPRNFHRGSDNNEQNSISATRESKGVFYVEIAATSSVVTTTYPYLVDVWSTPSSVEFFTGSAFTPKAHAPYQAKSDKTYVMTMTNLKTEYKSDQTARLRVYAREKNWSPNIYTTANATPENLIITSGSYRVLRIADDLEVLSYGTGSVKYSELSHDVSGNYLDMDMSLLEAGYQYGFKFSVYDDFTQTYVEQPYMFKFRVIK
jgi:hypothetical protein